MEMQSEQQKAAMNVVVTQDSLSRVKRGNPNGEVMVLEDDDPDGITGD